jgi:hypothetical protein
VSHRLKTTSRAIVRQAGWAKRGPGARIAMTSGGVFGGDSESITKFLLPPVGSLGRIRVDWGSPRRFGMDS